MVGGKKNYMLGKKTDYKYIKIYKKVLFIDKILNNEMTRKAVAEKLNVRPSTVGRWVKAEEKWRRDNLRGTPKKFAVLRQCRYPLVEEGLNLWLATLRAQKKSAPVSGFILEMKALE